MPARPATTLRLRALRRAATGLGLGAVVAAGGGVANAAAQTTAPTPRELWNAYPLEGTPGSATTDLRLPDGSVAPPPTAARRGADEGGSGATLPIVLAVGGAGLLTAGATGLLAGALLERRRRTAGATALEGPRGGAPEPASAAPPPAAARVPAAAAPLSTAPAPASVAPRAAEAPPAPPPAATPPPAADPPRSGRFERAPWPPEAEGRWQCEIAWEAGMLASGFQAVVTAPDGDRTRKVGRRDVPTDATPLEQRTAAEHLTRALIATGWELLPAGGGPWFAARFVWPQPGAPPRRLRSPAAQGDRR